MNDIKEFFNKITIEIMQLNMDNLAIKEKIELLNNELILKNETHENIEKQITKLNKNLFEGELYVNKRANVKVNKPSINRSKSKQHND